MRRKGLVHHELIIEYLFPSSYATLKLNTFNTIVLIPTFITLITHLLICTLMLLVWGRSAVQAPSALISPTI